MSCDTSYMGHLGRRTRWRHSCLNFVRGKVNVRPSLVKLGKIYIFQIFLQKHGYIVQFFLRIPKRHFLCTTIRNAKKSPSNSDSVTFTCFFGQLHNQKKGIPFIFYIRVVCMYIDNTYSGFWIS